MAPDPTPVPRHRQAGLSVAHLPGSVGYLLDGVPYGFVPLPGAAADPVRLALLHAAALGFAELQLSEAWAGAVPTGLQLVAEPAAPGSVEAAERAARLALTLTRLQGGQPVDLLHLTLLTTGRPVKDPKVEVVICTDGSADKHDGTLSVGYTLNGSPYALLLPIQGHESIAEREAIRVALLHAQALGFEQFRVRSDHLFHVRRYDENLIHRGRRKSETLEQLDGLVASLGPNVRFEYTATLDTDAPHRMALHVRALQQLAREEALSRAQLVALKRVHHALKRGPGLLF